MKKKNQIPKKPGPGRPVKNDFPEPIPDTMKNIARAVLGTPPKKEHEWKYLKSRS